MLPDMEDGMESPGNRVAGGRAEIDTSAPFQSVKEAVVLFGEKVLTGELYAGKINQAMASKREINQCHFVSVASELEETKQSLDRAREESQAMAIDMASLREELERTRRELQQLKERESEKRVIKEVVNKKSTGTHVDVTTPENINVDFQRRCVTFASPPSIRQVVIPKEEPALHRQTSLKDGGTSTKKKRNIFPLIGGLFSKKKGHQTGLPNVGRY